MEIELAMRTETDMDTNSFPPFPLRMGCLRRVARSQLLIWELVDPFALAQLARARAADDAY